MKNPNDFKFSKEEFEKIDQNNLDYEILLKILSVSKSQQVNYSKDLSTGMQMLFGTFTLEGDVLNGGFNQYFSNAEGYMPEMAYLGYKLIGADRLADLVDKATGNFMEYVHNKNITESTISKETLIESYDNQVLNELSSSFEEMMEEENVIKKRSQYIFSHKEEFVK